MSLPTRQVAKDKWHHILPEFGIEHRYLRNRHGPCPICAGTDRFRFDNKGGTGSFFCSQCGSGDGFTLAQKFTGMGFADVAARIDEICDNQDIKPEKQKPKKDPSIALKAIAAGLQKIHVGDPVYKYLKARGITADNFGHLRTHPALTYYEDGQKAGEYPAMVGAIRNKAGLLESLHITYLTPDGQKAPIRTQKKVMPPRNTINGCGIRLSNAKSTIAITEGVENALAVMENEGLPCWAAVSAHGIETFQPPEGVDEVIVYADNDFSFTGQAAATALCKRLVRDGTKADYVLVGQRGQDYLDYYTSTAKKVAA